MTKNGQNNGQFFSHLETSVFTGWSSIKKAKGGPKNLPKKAKRVTKGGPQNGKKVTIKAITNL